MIEDVSFLIALSSDCPFCGSNGDSLIIADSLEGPAKVVKCLGCGAIGPYGASNNELAVSFWNGRNTKVITTGTSATSNMAEE